MRLGAMMVTSRAIHEAGSEITTCSEEHRQIYIQVKYSSNNSGML